MLLRIRSRDGLERIQIDSPYITIFQLKTLIESQLQIPIRNQTLSTDQNLLLSKTPADLLRFSDMVDPSVQLYALNLCHGSVVFLFYPGERTVRGGPAFYPAGSFGREMTLDDLVAEQTPSFPAKYSSVSEEGRLEVDSICEQFTSLSWRDHEQDDLTLKFDSLSFSACH